MLSSDTIIRMAIAEANASDCRFKHGCVIYDKNIVKSKGCNTVMAFNRKLHPRFQRFPRSGIHAEASAILRARADLTGCSLLVLRINKHGLLLNSKPCSHCMMYIEYVGIKRVYYSCDGLFEALRL